MTGLEINIKNFIETQYEAEFLGEIKVDITDDEYCLNIITNNPMNPIVICSQSIDEDSFYTFITKEIANRDLVRVDYIKLIKTNENRKE
jgi:hypothetical protein